MDVNGNGILDPANGDYQVGGAAITDANGDYLFDNLPPGPYLVDVYEDSITTGGVRDIVPTTDNVRVVTLGPNQDVLDRRLWLLPGRPGRGQRLLGRGPQRPL